MTDDSRKSTVPWERSWGTYHTWYGSMPAMVTVDQGAVANAGGDHPYCCRVEIPMREPRADGLRSGSESGALVQVEDAIHATLGRASEPWFVGRLIRQGRTTLVFYLPGELATATASALGIGHYEPKLVVEHDTQWAFFFQHLWPNDFQRHLIAANVQRFTMAQQGDVPHRERMVDHFMLLPDAESAQRVAETLQPRGYRVSIDRKTSPVSVQATRSHTLEGTHIEAVLSELLDVIEPLGGSYEGWGAPITPPTEKASALSRLRRR